MINCLKSINKNHPRIVYTLYIIILTIIIDFTVAKIFWKQLATNDYYFVLGLGCKDHFFHHSLEKNVNVLWSKEGIPVLTNSLGFKDSYNRDVKLMTDKQRIIFIGDSFIEAPGLPFERSLVGLISKNLESKGVEVLNAGVSSYSPHLYFLKIQYLINNVKLKFNKLVVFIDMSDIQDEIVYKNYVPDEHDPGKSLGYYARYYMIKYSVIGNMADRIRSKIFKKGERGKLFLADEELLDSFDKVPTVTEPLLYGVWPYYEDFLMQRSLWYLESNYEKWGREGSVLADYYMSKLIKLCKEHNIEVTIAVYPWPQQVKEGLVKNKHVLFWHKFAIKHGIKFLNLFPLFMQLNPEISIKQFYFPGDVHFNEAGHMVIAREYLKRYVLNE